MLCSTSRGVSDVWLRETRCCVARRARCLSCVTQGDQMLCSTSREVSVLCGSGRPDVV